MSRHARRWAGRRCTRPAALVVLAIVVSVLAPAAVAAGPSFQQASEAAGRLAVGNYHSCAVLDDGTVRCWGYGADGQLGYGNRSTIGDDEPPSAAGPVDLGPGRTATAIAAGDYHTCALLDDGTVRCWGFGADGRLGYGNTTTIGDDETPAAAGPVDLGPGRTAKAISAGGGHTCALLDDGSVRCWGYGYSGELGYGDRDNVGDDETPGSRPPVRLGAGRRAVAISAGGRHTCAVLDDATVRCWGNGGSGRLGYGNQANIGDDETPDAAGPVDLGAGGRAVAVSAGSAHTCAVLDDGSARCWGFGASGQLGYGNRTSIGDDESPGSAGPVNLGPGRSARAISAGAAHTCALLDDGAVRCWGYGANGRLGYGNTGTIGDATTPGSVGPVALGVGRTALAVSAGQSHTCARLDDESVRCWGAGANGRLGYCSQNDVGDDEVPGSAGPVDLGVPGSAGAGCASAPPPGNTPPVDNSPTPSPLPPSGVVAGPTARDATATALVAQTIRATLFHGCRQRVARQARHERSRAPRRPTHRRASALRQIRRRAERGRRSCLKRYGHTPGRVATLDAKAIGRHTITLTFDASGTDSSRPPAAHTYLIKQSRRPIRTARDFSRAHSLCKGTCRFKVTRVGTTITLKVINLSHRRTYYYAVAARDNVSHQAGRRSKTVQARTR